MDVQVNLRLTALDGDMSPAERMIALNRDYNTVPVGRASKNSTKDLKGAVDNAWFNSPVMSRHHAQISFDTEHQTLSIQDIGSMHGTFLNNLPLARGTPKSIASGDTVCFGAKVTRGNESFPACSFRVNYDIVPYNRTANTYAFPDSSDFDDDDDELFSDEELERRHQASSEGSVPVELPPVKLSQAMDAIDLTRDDSPVIRESIDLTDEAPLNAHQAATVMLEHAASISRIMNPTQLGTYTCSSAIILDSDSDEDDGHLSSDSEDQSEEEQSDELESQNSDSDGSDGFDMDEDEEESEDEEDAMLEEYPAELSADPQAAKTQADHVLFPGVTFEPMQVEDSQIDEEDSDDQSEFGLSEAGAEGIRALFEDGVLESPQQHSSNPVAYNQALERSQATQPAPVPTATSYLDEMTDGAKQNSSVSSTFRQPSPSDAAMVKPPTITTNTQVLGKSQEESSQVKNDLLALGASVGKEAFFAAREANKAAAMIYRNVAGPRDYPSTVTSLHDGTRMTTSIYQNSWEPNYPVDIGSTPLMTISQRIPTASLASLDDNDKAFIDSYHPYASQPRVPSPEPDMTSAASYNASKELMAAAAVAVATPANKPRSRVSIDDIIETAPPRLQRKTLKRKAEDMAEVNEEELTTRGNSSSGPTQKIETQPTPTANADVEMTDAVPQPRVILEARPNKRFKKAMENLGYVALGGIAVGAGLFSALVVTAPDFL